MEEHTAHSPCSQGATMSVICTKLENLEKDLAEMKLRQREDMNEIRVTQLAFMEKMEAITLNGAKYPSPQEVSNNIKKIERHDTFFQIIFGVFVVLIPVVCFLIDKVWKT